MKENLSFLALKKKIKGVFFMNKLKQASKAMAGKLTASVLADVSCFPVSIY